MSMEGVIAVLIASIIGRFTFGIVGLITLVFGVIGYSASVNTPNISVRVAAMQTGIDATYPAYTPRGYSLSDVVSDEKKISIIFTNSKNDSYTITEEKTSWDSETLKEIYIKETWGDSYTQIREQGITIFVSSSDITWVNGNTLYKIKTSGDNLTQKQIKQIVTSL